MLFFDENNIAVYNDNKDVLLENLCKFKNDVLEGTRDVNNSVEVFNAEFEKFFVNKKKEKGRKKFDLVGNAWWNEGCEKGKSAIKLSIGSI